MGDLARFRTGNDSPEGLTCIHTPIHCVATQGQPCPGSHDELERVDIDNLLQTLTDIAISVARREQSTDDEGDRLHKGL